LVRQKAIERQVKHSDNNKGNVKKKGLQKQPKERKKKSRRESLKKVVG
jgi:hypothetical protein